MSPLVPDMDQQERIDAFLNEPTAAALVADEPGIGKTLVGVEIALGAGFQRVLVIGVKDTYEQWAELFSDQSDGEVMLRRIDSTKKGRANFDALLAGGDGFFFVGSQYLVRQDYRVDKVFDADGNPVMKVKKTTGEVTDKQETERSHLKIYKKMRPLDLVIWDESHVISNRNSLGFHTAKTIPTAYRLALSGTPGGNSFKGMWAPCRWLWPDHVDGSYWRWQSKWCATKEVYVGRSKTVTEVTGEKNPGAFVASLPLYFRAEAEPVPDAKLVYVDLGPRQREQYDALAEDMMVWFGDHPHVAELTVTQRQLMRTATLGEMDILDGDRVGFDPWCESAKLRALAGVLASWPGERALIGCDRVEFAEITAERMRLKAGLRVATWTGGTSSEERGRIKAAFLAGEVQYIVCTIASMSTGLDGFQKVCGRAVWLDELDGDHTRNEQWIRRLWRRGRRDDFEHVKILARDTWDEDTWRNNYMGSASMRRSLAA